mmetsp:Transcript_12271/g.26843  ORF Transcript_12271/g.26843 Transcript_12271/m.26843 type:complete len:81 (+) Transcript_12271:68-310(+)
MRSYFPSHMGEILEIHIEDAPFSDCFSEPFLCGRCERSTGCLPVCFLPRRLSRVQDAQATPLISRFHVGAVRHEIGQQQR